jgi:hypothetical protein
VIKTFKFHQKSPEPFRNYFDFEISYLINIFHFQVGEANIKAAASERSLAEANLKIDGLVTEVAGFKDMVLTSTPSKPNRHLHPQISGDKKLAAAKRAGKFSEKNIFLLKVS